VEDDRIMVTISIISTVKNEGATIRELLDSILSQSYLPDEIIIVDGGSEDNTLDILKSYEPSFRKLGVRFKILIDTQANIPEGRNLAIQNATSEIIVSVDGGCVLHKDFIRFIVTPFMASKVDVVGGRYEVYTRSKLGRVVAELMIPGFKRILRNPGNFLPPGGAIAFKRQCWDLVGGFPSWLNAGEDTLYDILLKNAGCNFYIEPNAIVYWRPRENLKDIFRQYFKYALGDGNAGIFTTKYLLTVYMPLFVGLTLAILGFFVTSYVLLLLLAGLFVFPILRAAYNGRDVKYIVRNIILAMIVSILVLIALASGYFVGRLKKCCESWGEQL